MPKTSGDWHKKCCFSDRTRRRFSLDHVSKMIKQENASSHSHDVPKMSTVDIAALTWQQREQVLKMAFAKINQQARTMQLRRLPSFGDAVKQQQKQQQASVTEPSGQPLHGIVSGAGKPKMA
jgi:hypothetical protein